MSLVAKPVLFLVAVLLVLGSATVFEGVAQGNGKGQGNGGGAGGNGNDNGPPEHAGPPPERGVGGGDRSGPSGPPADAGPGDESATEPPQPPTHDDGGAPGPEDPRMTPEPPAPDAPDAATTDDLPQVPPVALFFFEQDGPVVVVDAWDAYDPDGTILTYHWHWGDGMSLSGRDIEVHAYDDPFVAHTIHLTVIDDDGLRDTLALTVPAWDGPISAEIIAWAEGSTLVVDGGDSDATPFFITSWTWDWGDGSGPSAGILAEHRYVVPGTYTITLTVTDEAGRSASTTHEVSVEPARPARGLGAGAPSPAAKVTAAPHVVATSSGELPLIVLVAAFGLAARWPGRR